MLLYSLMLKDYFFFKKKTSKSQTKCKNIILTKIKWHNPKRK